MERKYTGSERREFLRLEYCVPLNYKICKKETINKLLEGYTSNISQTGILCRIKDKVILDDILWLSFDRDTLSICRDMEKHSLIYQNGIVGKVVRINKMAGDEFDVGVRFLTREERDTRHIYPKVHFLDGK